MKLISRLNTPAFIKVLTNHLHGSELSRRFSSGVFWNLIGNATWRFFSAVTTISVARILGPQGYGEFGMVQSTIRMISIYASFGLGPTATKYIAEFRHSDPARAARILHFTMFLSLLLCSSVSAALFLGSDYVSMRILEHPDLGTALAIGAVMLFSLIYGETKQQSIMGFENFRSIARINIIRGILTPLSCIPLALIWGTEGALAGLAFVTSVMLINSAVSLKKACINASFPVNTKLGDSLKEASILWRYALPGVLLGMLMTVVTWAGRLLLTRQENGFAELGIFEAAFQWQAIVLFLPGVFLQVLLPILSDTYNKDEKSDFRKAISMQVQSVLVITLPLVILTIGLSSPIAGLFGDEFEGTDIVISILMLSVFFSTISASTQPVFDGTGKRWTNLVIYIIWACVYIACAYQLIPSMGAIGFAYTHLIADALLFIMQTAYVDLVIAPGVMRQHFKLFFFSLALVASCYLAQSEFSGSTGFALASFLFLLGLIPIIIKLRSRMA